MSKTQLPFPIAALMGQNNGDNYITTVENTYRHYDVFLDDDIEEPSRYRELLAVLFNASEDDTINLVLNSNGGSLDSALAIVEGLKTTHAKVTAVLIGACHSAASIISMYCHQVVVLDSAYSMVHTASFGSAGNTNNVKAHTEFTVRQVEKLLNDTYEGFLTKDELAKVKTGVELWFDAEDIRKRMESRIKFLQAKIRKTKKKQEVVEDEE